MNTANEQTSNLTNNPQNSNLTNSGSKKFARDYDKEPLVIKSYERFVSMNLWLFSFFFGSMLMAIAYDLLYKNTFKNIGFNEVLIFILFLLGMLALSYYYYAIRHRYEIRFTNNSINFYRDGELRRASSHKDLEEIIAKPFWRKSLKLPRSDKIFWLVMFIFGIIAFGWFLIFYLFMICFSNMLFKLCFYIFLNRNLKYFRLFPIIIIDEPLYPNYFLSSEAYILAGKYYYVYIFNEDQYKEIKTYFLDRKNIDIDEVKKYYFT